MEYHKYITNKGTDTRFSFDAVLNMAGDDWTNTRRGKYKAKVNDRSTEPPYSQCVCLKITKESVTALHRRVLHDEGWEFPKQAEEREGKPVLGVENGKIALVQEL